MYKLVGIQTEKWYLPCSLIGDVDTNSLREGIRKGFIVSELSLQENIKILVGQSEERVHSRYMEQFMQRYREWW